VSPKLRAELEADSRQLVQMVAEFRCVAQSAMTDQPGKVEVAALAAVLHAYYNGVENALTRLRSVAMVARPPRATSSKEHLHRLRRFRRFQCRSTLEGSSLRSNTVPMAITLGCP